MDEGQQYNEGIDPREAEAVARAVDELLAPTPEQFMADSPYSQGGSIPGGPVLVTIDPDECIVRATDVAAGRWVCGRGDHPTPTSDCAPGRRT